jgi:hypothetical protein
MVKDRHNQVDGVAVESQPINTDSGAVPPPKKYDHHAIVHLLDGNSVQFGVDRKAKGAVLFGQVADFLNLGERDYFALSFRKTDGSKNWLYVEHRISKQVEHIEVEKRVGIDSDKRGDRYWEFHFEVKFYPPEPAALAEDLTRYLLYLQVRRDIYSGKLPATIATYALLGSYVAQSDMGDFSDENADAAASAYNEALSNARLTPVPNAQFFDKVKELHKAHKGQTPADAELHYLENAKKLAAYGVHIYPAKDNKGIPVSIGVCAHGLIIYRDQIRINRFVWPKINVIAYRRHIFSIKLRPGEVICI